MINNLQTELLAPAKDKATAIAAIDCGADAIYIGAAAFGARQNASNSTDDIKEITEYAHKFHVKVFVTVNTILTDTEVEKAVALIKQLDLIGVDAILVQDMGLLLKLAETGLSVPIHMSTQCDNRAAEKIKFFSDMGVSRVVLARELSLKQIKEIHEMCPNTELEAFIHGALCVSYSGQCYLSQYIGGRSANRGECAQPCRKKYTVQTDYGKILAENIHALCLKDLNAHEHIADMIKNGIFSFKIEGRLKDITYVKNIVSYYRNELDKYSSKTSSGKSTITFKPDSDKTFNRGYTDYFLTGRTNCHNLISPKSVGKFIGTILETKKDCLIIETKEKLNPQDGLCFIDNNELKGFLINKAVNNKTIYPNKLISVKKGTKIFRNYDAEFEKELLKPVKRQIGLNVIVNNNQIELTDEDGISVVMKLDSSEIANNQEKMQENFIKQFSKTGDSDFYIEKLEILSKIPFMPISSVNQLRRNSFNMLSDKRIKEYKRQIQKPLKFVPYYKKEDNYKANVNNNAAKEFYKKCDCNITEMCIENQIPPHQIELMRCKYCIKYALNMCKSPDNLILIDEKGKKYPLKFDCKNCEMIVLSEK